MNVRIGHYHRRVSTNLLEPVFILLPNISQGSLYEKVRGDFMMKGCPSFETKSWFTSIVY